MTRRSKAREVALQILFQRDQNPKGVARAAIEGFVSDRLNQEVDLRDYCLALYDGVSTNLTEIDALLTAAAENWRLNRMTAVDRNVLRLGTFELLFDPAGQPIPVAIDEGIELARRFGSKDSPAFVNGILDKISRVRDGVSNRRETTEGRSPERQADPSV